MYAYKPPSFTQKVQQTSKSSRKSSQQRDSGLCEAITTCVGSCTTMLPARGSGNRKGKSRISGFTMDQCTLPSPNSWPPGPSFSVIVGAIASRHGKGLNKQQKITIYDVRILAFEVATKGNSSNPYTSDLKQIRYSLIHSCLLSCHIKKNHLFALLPIFPFVISQVLLAVFQKKISPWNCPTKGETTQHLKSLTFPHPTSVRLSKLQGTEEWVDFTAGLVALMQDVKTLIGQRNQKLSSVYKGAWSYKNICLSRWEFFLINLSKSKKGSDLNTWC